MNATSWTTLTGFVRYLGRTGKVVADETEKGWFITYIDRDPETIARQEALAKKQKLELDDQERTLSHIEKQVQRGKESAREVEEIVDKELKRDEDGEKIVFQLPAIPMDKSKVKKEPQRLGYDDDKGSSSKIDKDSKKTVKNDAKEASSKRKLSALDEIIKLEESKKEKMGRKDYWLTEDIVVKVVTKSLGDKYYKKKGYVKEVIDLYSAIVCMLDTGHKLKLDQDHLETVIPAEGRAVRVVNGAHRGCTATLKSLDEKNFGVTITLDSGSFKGRVVEGVQYEDVSKIHTPQ